MVNSTKLNENLIHITNDTSSWVQSTWAESSPSDVPPVEGECGTSFCLAGWAVVNEGYKLEWNKAYTGRVDPVSGKELYTWHAERVLTPDGKSGEFISSVAQRILGLSDDEMFAGGNSLARLWTMAEEKSGGKIKRPANAPQGDGYSEYNEDESDEYGGLNCSCGCQDE